MTASLITLLLSAMGCVSAATPCPGGETPTTVTSSIQAGADDAYEYDFEDENWDTYFYYYYSGGSMTDRDRGEHLSDMFTSDEEIYFGAAPVTQNVIGLRFAQ
eukprot:2375708-Heterocapsa_arctica.AAC.1